MTRAHMQAELSKLERRYWSFDWRLRALANDPEHGPMTFREGAIIKMLQFHWSCILYFRGLIAQHDQGC